MYSCRSKTAHIWTSDERKKKKKAASIKTPEQKLEAKEAKSKRDNNLVAFMENEVKKAAHGA